MSVLLRKALEMGDQVIGHTGAKKPIFANKGADHPHYANYSAADHIVAANVHANRAKELNIASSRAGGSMTLKRQAAQSTHFATTHRQAGMGHGTRLAASTAARANVMQSINEYRTALSKAAGSRGGRVLGTTRSGKPIYQSSIKNMGTDLHRKVREDAKEHIRGHLPHFTAEDHEDAANAHLKHANEIEGHGKRTMGFHNEIAVHTMYGRAKTAAQAHSDLAAEGGIGSRHRPRSN